MSTEITTVEYMVPAETYAQYGADFDPEAVNDAVLAELNARIPKGVRVERNGIVTADDDSVETARALNWDQLLASIDVDQILAAHGR